MNKDHGGLRVLTYLSLIIGSIIMLFPFLWMISTSLKARGALLAIPPSLLPSPIQWDNFAKVWIDANFVRYSFNSVIITGTELIGMLLSCALVAYGLAMFKFRGRNLIFVAMLSTMILPGQVTLIPTYFIWKSLGVLDSYYPLIVPSYIGKAFGIFLLHQYFKSLPRDLYEAAWVDGANPWYIFCRIYFPLSAPALGTLGIFTFINSWNDTIGPLIYLQDRNLYTLPLALLYLQNDIYTDVSLVMAGAVVTTIPVILVFLFAQKYFIKGIAAGG